MATDIAQWMAQGKSMLSDLESRRHVLEAELATVNESIAATRKAMGMAPAGAGQKVMVRSVIKQALMAHAGALVSEVQLISDAQQIQPKATVASLRVSLQRALRLDKWIREQNGSYAYVP